MITATEKAIRAASPGDKRLARDGERKGEDARSSRLCSGEEMIQRR